MGATPESVAGVTPTMNGGMHRTVPDTSQATSSFAESPASFRMVPMCSAAAVGTDHWHNCAISPDASEIFQLTRSHTLPYATVKCFKACRHLFDLLAMSRILSPA